MRACVAREGVYCLDGLRSMLAFSQSRRLTRRCNTVIPFGPRIQEQDVLQDDLWRVQASDLVWVRSTRCVGTQRHPRGESVPHVEDRSGLSQACRGGDLDTYRSAGCSRFKAGSAVRHFIEWRNRPARPCTCRPSRTAVLHDRPRRGSVEILEHARHTR